MDFTKNKRGQGMSTNTIILLILGVLVLVFLIIGFSAGFGKVLPFIKSSNVDNVVNNCEASCSTQSVYDYCRVQRELKDAEDQTIETTCAVFAGTPEFSKYGFSNCNIDCELSCEDIQINGAQASEDLNSGTYNVSSVVSQSNCIVA